MSQKVLTRSEIIDFVQGLVRDKRTTNAALINTWIHEVHRDIEKEADFPWLRRNSKITLRPGVATYVVDSDYHKPADHYCMNLNGQPIHYISETEFLNNYYSNQTDVGTPTNYRDYGERQFIKNQVISPSRIILNSTSSSDTAITVFIRGVVDGYDDAETITLSGIPDVVSIKTFQSVKAITLNAEAVGHVFAKSNGGSNTLVRIPAGSRAIGFKTITFFPTPTIDDDGDEADFWWISHIPDLIHNSDVSIVPDNNTLLNGVLSKFYQFHEDNQKMGYFEAKYQSGKDRMKLDMKRRRDKYSKTEPIFNDPRSIS